MRAANRGEACRSLSPRHISTGMCSFSAVPVQQRGSANSIRGASEFRQPTHSPPCASNATLASDSVKTATSPGAATTGTRQGSRPSLAPPNKSRTAAAAN